MKTAVSIPDAAFRAGELLAKLLKLTRSRLYALALADFVERHADGGRRDFKIKHYVDNP